jgi:hypothetical protein
MVNRQKVDEGYSEVKINKSKMMAFAWSIRNKEISHQPSKNQTSKNISSL